MKLQASQLFPGENKFEFENPKDVWLGTLIERISKQGYELTTPMTVSLSITKLEPDFFLRGNFKAGVKQTCARCVEYFTLPVVHPFDIALAHVSSGKLRSPEVTEQSDELDITFFEGNEIDLDPILEEQFFLSIPYQSLCRPDCQGICQSCGGNRNTSPCNCSEQRALGPFSALENYQFS